MKPRKEGRKPKTEGGQGKMKRRQKEEKESESEIGSER